MGPIQVGAEIYKVVFSYPMPGVTDCILYQDHGYPREPIWICRASSRVARHVNDKENRIVGRKYALRKALSPFPREQRRVFWEEIIKQGFRVE